MADTIAYLKDVLDKVDTLNTKEEVNRQLDDVEFLYDAVDPTLQELVDQVVTRLRQRLKTLP